MSYIDSIDFSRLRRDYRVEPLRAKEILTKEELEYLYIELNNYQYDLWEFLGVRESKFRSMLKFYNIVKPKELHQALIQKTTFEHYGSKAPMGNPELREKIQNTKKKIYGEHLEKVVEKCRKTSMEKYGVSHTNYLKWKQDKISETTRKHFGVNRVFSLPDFQRRYPNCAKNISRPEKRCLNFLKKKFPDIISQYKDLERYPFNCDFYIPSLDLFIECQFGPHHQCCAFDKNNQLHQLRKIRLLQSKSERVRGWASCWSEYDVMKRNIALENKIRFLEFFKEDDLYKFFRRKKYKEFINQFLQAG